MFIRSTNASFSIAPIGSIGGSISSSFNMVSNICWHYKEDIIEQFSFFPVSPDKIQEAVLNI